MCEETFLVEFLLDKHIQNVHSAIPGSETAHDSQEKSPKTVSIKVQ
jgi:hypothetical protein